MMRKHVKTENDIALQERLNDRSEAVECYFASDLIAVVASSKYRR